MGRIEMTRRGFLQNVAALLAGVWLPGRVSARKELGDGHGAGTNDDGPVYHIVDGWVLTDADIERQ